jgi:hypothetical protein
MNETVRKEKIVECAGEDGEDEQCEMKRRAE